MLSRSRVVSITAMLCSTFAATSSGQEPSTPALRVGALTSNLKLDGVLDEPAWLGAEAIDAFRQTDPAEGAAASARTQVRALASPKGLVLGITCDQPPDEVVSFSVRRDAPLGSEDHIRIVLGPSLDGRSGYVFSVNPSGARYDALINPGGETENPDWDGIWEAATKRSTLGWSVEIWIPIHTLSFNPSLRQWNFNVQRRIQRKLETDRWAFPARQYRVTQTS